MQVFKYFFKVLNQYKSFIILYTVMLVLFGTLNFSTNDSSFSFEATTPNIMVINNDEMNGITKHFYNYLDKNAEIKNIKTDKDSLADALFYRDVSYIITIPKDFSEDMINGNNPMLEIESTGDYEATYAEMLVNKYMNLAKSYLPYYNEEELLNNMDKTLKETTEIKIKSKIANASEFTKATFFYNFAGYSLLAGAIYIISMILCSFREKNVHKRTTISSIKIRDYNKSLLFGNSAFVVSLLIVYIIISIVLIKDAMLTSHGLLYIMNTFMYSMCALTMGFLVGNITNNKEAIGGIVNVVGLGSAFLCGCFVPLEFLPKFVISFSKILPTYWFVQNNEFIKTLEEINFETLKPFINNLIIILAFCVIFIIISNLVARSKRKFN